MITEENLNSIIAQRGNIAGVILRACPIDTQQDENVSDVYLVDDNGCMELLNLQLVLPFGAIDEDGDRVSLKPVLTTKRTPGVNCIGDEEGRGELGCSIQQDGVILEFDSSGIFLLTGFLSPIARVWLDGQEIGVDIVGNFSTNFNFTILDISAIISERLAGTYSIRVVSEDVFDSNSEQVATGKTVDGTFRVTAFSN